MKPFKTSDLYLLIFYTALIIASTSCRTNSNSMAIRNKHLVKLFHSASNEVLLKEARISFLDEDYANALMIYKKLLNTSYSKKARTNYKIGECYLAMKNYTAAIDFLEKAKAENPKVHKDLNLLLGQAYHLSNKLDQAIEVLEEYTGNKHIYKEDYTFALALIEQCKTAKILISNPVNTKIKNLGSLVNSPFEDYGPSVSADGKILVFTSRRREVTGIGIDPADGKYFEDVFLSTWNDSTNSWNKAESVRGRLNSYFHDAALSISPDGKQIFVYRNTPGETGSGDIYVSNLTTYGRWSSPKPLTKQINTSYFESSASLSADGNYLYFISEKRGGLGNGDIYRSKKIGKNAWGPAENLGAVINSGEDESSVFIHPDGKTLYFSSKGHQTMGGYDIFKSVFENGQWSKPENMGYPINTLQDDLHFVLTEDNRTAYYSTTNKDELHERDIYEIDMNNHETHALKESLSKEHLSVSKGSVNGTGPGKAVEATVEIVNLSGKVISTALN